MWKSGLQDPRILGPAAGLAGLVLGLSAGVLATKKTFETKYSKLAESEIAEVKRFYALQAAKEEIGLDEMAEKYHEQANKYNTRTLQAVPNYTEPQPTPEPDPDKDEDDGVKWPLEGDRHEGDVLVSVFDSDDPETYFVYSDELRRRRENPDRPFVISKEEFDENEGEHNQVTVTYWESDQVLVDDRDEAVDDLDKIVGASNMDRFGHGSGDKNVVYVRNMNLSVDFEVLRSNGDYKKDVLGFIEHSDKPGLRRFRLYD